MSVSSNILKENSRDLLRELEEPCDYDTEPPIDDDDDTEEDFPTTSIRVLLVDSDPKSLLLMKYLMTQLSYQVTNYKNGDEAITFLMKSKHEIDLVIWDFHVPEINGLEALNTISKEMDLPVVIISHDYEKETVKKSMKYGACDFLVKPVSKEVIVVLWRHVYLKRMSKYEGLGQNYNDDHLYQSNEEGSKKVEQNTSVHKEDMSSSNKRRVTWTPELHHKFQVAIEKLGSRGGAVPKKILTCMEEEMNVEGLTRSNVASHLQKYRQKAVKKAHVSNETRQDPGWRNIGPNANANLAASKPLLNSSINLPYYMNDQAAANAPIQYPSSSYLTRNNQYHLMTNPFVNLPYIDHSSLQLPSVITKQDPGHVSSSMENSNLIYHPTLPYNPHEYFPPGSNNFNQTGPY